MESGSAFYRLAIIGQVFATVGGDGVGGFEIGNVFVDDRFVDDLPKRLGGLKFRGAGRKEEKADAVGNFQIGFAMPTGVVQDENENENDDPISAGSGVFSESR